MAALHRPDQQLEAVECGEDPYPVFMGQSDRSLPPAFHGKRTGMTPSNIQPDDYISFSGLRTFLGDLFRFFFKCCRLATGSIRNRIWLVITGTLLGGSLGLLYHMASGQKYKVSMLVQYRVLDKTIYRNIISDLNQMIVYGSRGQVAAQLGVPLRLIERVNKLGTADLNGKPLTEESISNFPIFE